MNKDFTISRLREKNWICEVKICIWGFSISLNSTPILSIFENRKNPDFQGSRDGINKRTNFDQTKRVFADLSIEIDAGQLYSSICVSKEIFLPRY